MRTGRKLLMLMGGGGYAALMQSYIDAGKMLAWYKAEEASGNLADSSGNGFTATGTNLTYQQDGRVDFAVNANGTDSAIAGPAGLSTAFTGGVFALSMWYKTSAWTDGVSRFLCNVTTANGDRFQVYKANTNNRIIFDVQAGGVIKQVVYTISGTDWTHIVLVLTDSNNGDFMRCYVNGELVGSQTGFGNWTGATSYVRFVYNYSSSGTYYNVWNGEVDEIVLLKTVPTTPQIRLLADPGAT